MAKTASGEAVAAETSKQPVSSSLGVAYPNPFNPQTVIPFVLPEAATVKLEVFDVLGRRIATLADGPFEAGSHQAVFDGTGQASGIYVVRASIGTGHRTQALSQTITLMK